jgi:hypothetical protein
MHRQVGRLLALENPTGIIAGEAVSVRNVISRRHGTTKRDPQVRNNIIFIGST